MSVTTQNPQERAFHCPHCNGRIVIPADLPPTTGPCPHCKGTITSPALDYSYTPLAQTPNPQTPPPSGLSAEAATIVLATKSTPAAPVTYEAPEIPEENEVEEPVPSKKSAKKSSPLLFLFIFILLLGALGGGGYYVMVMMKPKDEVIKPLDLKQPAKPLTNPALEKFIAAATLDEKLKYVYNAEALRPKIEAFYKDKSVSEADTPANLFTTVKIPGDDTKKGFILLNYDQPASKTTTAPSAQRTKVLAFLKETEQGVKLDWEVFAQTKYRTLSSFIKTPTAGKSEVFRVIAIKDPADKTPGYLLADPAHQTDSVKIVTDPKSPAGQALARLDQESAKSSGLAKHTATIELTWAGDPKKPQIQIKRFICWEFLNLGGKEIPETPPSN